jgi:hypothetical protein
MRVDDENWGHGTFTADAPEVSIEAYLAYLQFKWPETDILVTAGYQPVSLPQSTPFYDSLVLASDDGDQSTAALVVSSPLWEDVLSINAGFTRLVDTNGAFDADTTQAADEFDAYFLNLPIAAGGLKVSPGAWSGWWARPPTWATCRRDWPRPAATCPGRQGIRPDPVLVGRGLRGTRRP